MAKKWQDVEFVDYKEHQKRRRLRKREAVQEELASAVGSRLNISLIVFVVSSFIICCLQENTTHQMRNSKTAEGRRTNRRDERTTELSKPICTAITIAREVDTRNEMGINTTAGSRSFAFVLETPINRAI